MTTEATEVELYRPAGEGAFNIFNLPFEGMDDTSKKLAVKGGLASNETLYEGSPVDGKELN